jgi:hypothetical protein
MIPTDNNDVFLAIFRLFHGPWLFLHSRNPLFLNEDRWKPNYL